MENDEEKPLTSVDTVMAAVTFRVPQTGNQKQQLTTIILNKDLNFYSLQINEKSQKKVVNDIFNSTPVSKQIYVEVNLIKLDKKFKKHDSLFANQFYAADTFIQKHNNVSLASAKDQHYIYIVPCNKKTDFSTVPIIIDSASPLLLKETSAQINGMKKAHWITKQWYKLRGYIPFKKDIWYKPINFKQYFKKVAQKTQKNRLSTYLPWIFGAAALGTGGYALYRRPQQAKKDVAKAIHLGTQKASTAKLWAQKIIEQKWKK